jgi:uncharacterized protein YutE (UPF0331/DUF86 family)
MTTTKETESRFESFMKGFSAAVQLSERAVESGSFIESVCLSASTIDAQLRTGLILNHQLQTASSDLLDDLLHQSDESKIVTERSIYKRALKESIISEDIYKELNDLYHKRNRVVHRYIISDITTDEVLGIAQRYSNMVYAVNQSVRKLEDEQLRRGVGMTVAGDRIPESIRGKVREMMDREADEKHGNANLAKNLRNPPKSGAS